MENALRFRIEKAKKELIRLQREKAIQSNPYATGLIDGQIMGVIAEINTLEDMLLVHEELMKKEVI